MPTGWFSITYEDQSTAAGPVYTDAMTIGSDVIKEQVFGAAERVNQLTILAECDGVLGLAFGLSDAIIPPSLYTPPFLNMIREGIIQEKNQIFTAYLRSWRDKPSEGFYTFGAIDGYTIQASGATQVNYTDLVDSADFWTVPSDSMTINGRKKKRKGNNAIIDTGTSLMYLDKQIVDSIYKAVPNAQYSEIDQGWILPSNTPLDQIPNLSFAIGDQQFPMHKEDLFYSKSDFRGDYTYGSIQQRDNVERDIFGLAFLKSIYAVSLIVHISS
jgi:hypothetical protein